MFGFVAETLTQWPVEQELHRFVKVVDLWKRNDLCYEEKAIPVEALDGRAATEM
jgi:hypothetical protein